MTQTHGTITQVIGVVVDVEFPHTLPAVLNALTVKPHLDTELLLEVAQHLSSNTVRTIALGSTDGLKRGQEVIDTGQPIAIPVGEKTLGRMFDVTGKPIDGKAGNFTDRQPIHKSAPKFIDQNTRTEIFETGIKVIDLIAPITKGGKVGLRRA